ncbi:MAG TPA: PQQ-binding-like beta-propeller repeat protein [Acidimicrobiia bacterium]|nr:PQQ-binding-like beta-propeller repeat protein [Acidimicrobiia bacterium]
MGESARALRLAQQRRRDRRRLGVFAMLVGLVTIAFAVTRALDEEASVTAGPTSTPGSGSTAPDVTEPASTTTTIGADPNLLVDPAAQFGARWGSTTEGLLTFRGNPTRSFHGTGPVPERPEVLWRFPDEPMCAQSADRGETRTWCGMGWTGQPAVFERDERTWVVFGAYDRNVHFVDGLTGTRILPDFVTGDIIKGSVTIDPDGFPIVYSGSRDGFFRAIAFDRDEPTELWRLSADGHGETLWNDDWDGSALILRDHLLEGGENSRFHIARLGRAYGADGLVTVAPELVFSAPGWDAELLDAIGDREVSIENSVAVAGDVVYFANSGGLLQGWDVSSLRTGVGTPTRVFRYWLGDDADASVVVDDDGFLYVGVEYQRENARAEEVGQLVKLDPRAPDAPIVWSVPVRDGNPGGSFSTPAVLDDLVIWPTRNGTVYGLGRDDGAERWTLRLPAPLMGSPVVVDGVWLQGDCAGVLHAYDLPDGVGSPRERWAVELGGCIEATPAVWDGRIYVGTRGGFLHALGDPPD